MNDLGPIGGLIVIVSVIIAPVVTVVLLGLILVELRRSRR